MNGEPGGSQSRSQRHPDLASIFRIDGDDEVAISSGRSKPYGQNIANGIATAAVIAVITNHLQDTSSNARTHIGAPKPSGCRCGPRRMSPAAGCGPLDPGVTLCSAASLFGAGSGFTGLCSRRDSLNIARREPNIALKLKQSTGNKQVPARVQGIAWILTGSCWCAESHPPQTPPRTMPHTAKAWRTNIPNVPGRRRTPGARSWVSPVS